MERAARSPFRPGPSLFAAVVLSTTVLSVPAPAPPPAGDASTPPVVSDLEEPAGEPGAVPEVAIPRPVSRIDPGRVVTEPYTDPSATPYPVSSGVPAQVHLAYQRAADRLATNRPGCRLPVALLAAIGRVESGHARGGRVDARGTTVTPILGPRLDGSPGLAAIRDTDDGVHDGDAEWDRAVGPMQFIPGTWRAWAADGNDDGVADPHNVHDSALAAGGYLCADDRDLSTADGLRAAVLSYNRSDFYLHLVLRWMAVYERGITPGTVWPTETSPPEGTGGGPGPVTAVSARRPGTAPGGPGAPAPGSPAPQAPAAADRPPATPPATSPAAPPTTPPTTPPATPDSPTLADAVGETLCVVDGIVVSVTTVTTSLLGGLLDQDVTVPAAGSCGSSR